MPRFRPFTALLVWVVCALASTALPAGTALLPRAIAAPPVITSPASLATTVALGQRDTRVLTVSNSSGNDATLNLYEAFAASATPAARSREVAPELRRVALPRQTSKSDPVIRTRMAAAPDGKTDFIVFLQDQADLTPAYQAKNWADRGWIVYRILHDHAEQSQASLRALLDARGTNYTPFWIVNALAVRGSVADVQALEARADVAVIQATQNLAVDPVDSQPAADLAAIAQCNPLPSDSDNPICWNIRTLGADRVWKDFGINGQGITVGNIDTGVNYTHVALVQQYRGYHGTDQFDHNYNWFDPQGTFNAPSDGNGHGTHTMGSMVAKGNGTTDEPAVGVAPGARWIAAQGCEQTTCSEKDLIAAAQWMVAPTDQNGQNPRPDLRPHIINNSWSGNSNDTWYAGYTAAWRAAGIFPVFAAGNKSSGATCGSIQSPGDYPDVLGVGATDLTDTIANFSTRGPTKDGRLKPDVSGPGVQIVSTYIGSNTKYAFLQGTSMAAPQAAGVVALLWSANPELIGDYDTTYALLTGTAKRISDTRCGDAEGAPNNLYGYGRIRSYDAVASAEVDVPWLSITNNHFTLAGGASQDVEVKFDATKVAGPGTYTARILIHGDDLSQDALTVTVTMTVPSEASQAQISGRVTDAESGAALTAHVAVAGGVSVPVDSNGAYTITLPTALDPYTIVASARGYLSVTATVALTEPLQLTLPFSLKTDLQALMVSTDLLSASLHIGETAMLTATIRNNGTQPLSYTASIPTTVYGVWPSDSAQTTLALQVPSNAIPISLSDDGTIDDAIPLGFDIAMYGSLYNAVYVNANGMIGLGPHPNPTTFSSSCGPTNTTSGAALLPFYADLDPSQGGQISYATTSEGFVITYDQVPLHQQTPTANAPTYTFQVVIKPNSYIIYRYGKLGPLPGSLTVGVQRDSFDGQMISCGNSSIIQSGRSLELRPQPSSDLWAGLLGDSATIPPGGSATMNLVLAWIRPNGDNQPMRAEIVLTSDDPRQPEARIPFTLTNNKAPYENYFPFIAAR